jgi:hypothetical protein
MRLSALRLPFVAGGESLFAGSESIFGVGVVVVRKTRTRMRRENDFVFCHCEQRSDEAIQNRAADWIASLRSR